MTHTFVVASDGSLYWEGKRRRSGGYAVVTQAGVLLDGSQLPGLRSVDAAEHLGLTLALVRAVEALGSGYGGAVVVTDQMSVVEKPRSLDSRLHVPSEYREVVAEAQEMIYAHRLKVCYSTSHKPSPYQFLMGVADRLAAGFAVGLVTDRHLGTDPVPPSKRACRREWTRTDSAPPAEHTRGA